MRVLITGAAGYIGGRMAQALFGRDFVETIVGTDIRRPDDSPEGVAFYQRDIRGPIDDIFEKEKIDAVIHAAYVLPPIHDKGKMEAINKGGTTNVLDAAKRFGVTRILYTSSTTAYGFWPDNDEPLTEESPLRGNDDFTYAKNKKEIEAIFRDFIQQNPEIGVTIVRPCFVVGPGFKNPLAEHLQKRVVPLPSNSRPWQFVHEDDLVEVMARLLENGVDGIFNVTGEGTVTFAEMVKMLGNTYLPVPGAVMFPLNSVAWKLRLSFITKFPSPAMNMMVNPWIAAGDKLKKELDYQFKYDSRGAFQDFANFVKKG